jgi:three-Cys-motif partner protein
MPISHQFGGNWTEEKLERLRKYLPAYTKIFTRNERASWYTTTYVDAFAGTGYRHSEKPSEADNLTLFDEDAEAFTRGSAQIALETEPRFDRYLFIERNPDHVAELENLRQQFPDRAEAITIEKGEANDALVRWCKRTNWRRNRAVVFLDPYGMQVKWSTLETLASTKGVDLWLLFPLGQAVNRLLTRRADPPQSWASALTRTFGTEMWRPAFYRPRVRETLFETTEGLEKEANFEAIGQFFVDRLRTIFTHVAENPLPLRNSSNTPIYLLCFAAENKDAEKIARHILRI